MGQGQGPARAARVGQGRAARDFQLLAVIF